MKIRNGLSKIETEKFNCCRITQKNRLHITYILSWNCRRKIILQKIMFCALNLKTAVWQKDICVFKKQHNIFIPQSFLATIFSGTCWIHFSQLVPQNFTPPNMKINHHSAPEKHTLRVRIGRVRFQSEPSTGMNCARVYICGRAAGRGLCERERVRTRLRREQRALWER